MVVRSSKICKQNPIVELFQGKTTRQLFKVFGDERYYDSSVSHAIDACDVNHNGRIEPGEETGRVAAYFVNDPTKEFKDAGFGVYAYLLTNSCQFTMKDVEDYIRSYIDHALSKKRPKMARELGLSKVDHPFAKVAQECGASDYHSFRGISVFDKLATTIEEMLPQVRETKHLNVLYPASGAHIAPLLTAMRLMDRGAINSARFTFTEIDEDYGKLEALLEKFHNAGIFSGDLKFIVKDISPGKEVVFLLDYNGKSIIINLLINRSGENYYRQSDLKTADVVIIHDPGSGHLDDSYDLLRTMEVDKESERNVGQLYVMEGKPTTLRVGAHQRKDRAEIPGQYGHCEGFLLSSGEINECCYSSAYVWKQ